ncbi:MAG: ferritin [Thermoplasmata archaeon]|nr:ferritin [Thermoplasmata archaeon]
MINKKVEKAINDQINAEMYSSYLYVSMASDMEGKSLPGFAHWMKSQAQEELMHAMKFYDFIVERGGRVILKGIDGPQTSWKNPTEMVAHVYKHEQHVTGLINSLMDLAIKEKDHATVNFLQWFVKEQVEEESTASDILQKLKLIGGKGDGLFMIDKELAARVPLFTFPLPGAQA